MARVTVEDCLEKENNRFSLVLLAAQRAKQLLSGARLLIPETDNKAIVNSLREIAAGKVRYMNEEDFRLRREQEQADRDAALTAARPSQSLEAQKNTEAESSPTNGNGYAGLTDTESTN
jgi:DNA-directed RNA polymerase subunit omega